MYKAFTKSEQFVTELKDLKVDRSGMMCIDDNWHEFHVDETYQSNDTSTLYRKVEVEKMATEKVDLKKIISNLAKLGVSATATKSRLEMLKALAPPASDPQIQS